MVALDPFWILSHIENHEFGMCYIVVGVPAQRYIQQFAWDSAKYPNRRPLKELVAMIAGGATGIEEELKQLTTSFADKQVALPLN